MIIQRLLLCLTTLLPMVGFAAEPDWSDYASLLQRHLTSGTKNNTPLTLVNYATLKADPRLGRVVTLVADYPTNALANPQEKMAFYINAYNILALKMVVDHWPVASIKEAGSFFTPVWKKAAGKAVGQEVTLDEIEHKILRPMGDPRIHMAIVCASVSCPDLRKEPYTAAHLSGQLDDQATVFLNNTAKGLRLEGETANLSKIFEWFGQDFEPQGGVEVFVRRYHPLPQKIEFYTGISYDWSLNGQ